MEKEEVSLNLKLTRNILSRFWNHSKVQILSHPSSHT